MSETTGEFPYSNDELRRLSGQITDLVTSQEFLDRVQQVLGAREGQRLSEAATLLTPSALREAGFPVPDSVRVSSRYFEEGRPGEEATFTDSEGSRDILQLLHEQDPGILDRIRVGDPELLERMKKNPFPGGDIPMAGICACVGGGAGVSVCLGVGAT
ncbi:hypothetical protein [Streptomyces sp. SPB4]|uniref:hypothetical protein n=1 Tax=Streptomyces sp. SPB4 TaxID=2940553 RepID=UPI00247431A3|nr:hypothetical protein [Streptomyces sp. SPB4]MDH6543742.1 hypothetical protein [Streptomyces sp. SPB4]